MNSYCPRLVFRLSTIASLVLFASLLTAHAASLTQREHLTPEEIEQVRENQELDKRIGVFVKAVERRMQAATGQSSPLLSKQAQKLAQKDEETLGALPPSTRAQLFSDIAKILDEAIVNIDDAAIHAAKSPLVPKALRKLADAAGRILPQLTTMRDAIEAGGERESLELAIENAQSIVEAAKKIPSETKK
ncbi:MAG TPA: hypothetical protein VF666_02465 [Pyrinomonadaceae bacterium]|jgi:hypothetical protein